MEKTIEWIKVDETSGFSRMVDQLVIPYEYKKVDIKKSYGFGIKRLVEKLTLVK